MNISGIQTILDICKWFVDGNAMLGDLADALDEPLGKLHTLLSSNGIIEINGDICPGIASQDLVNTILLYYAMRYYHGFVEVSWRRSPLSLGSKKHRDGLHASELPPP